MILSLEKLSKSTQSSTRARATIRILFFGGISLIVLWYFFSPPSYTGYPSDHLEDGIEKPHKMPPFKWWDRPPPQVEPVFPPAPPSPPPINGAPPPIKGQRPDIWAAKAESVKQSMIHAYHGYEKAAFGYDELLPTSNGSVQNFNGWGVMIVDSLDTLLLMDLKDEYQRGIEHIATLRIRDHNGLAPFFETVIRYLGGFLSAYALTHDPILLTRADDLGTALLPVFDTSSGLPKYGANPKTKATQTGWMGSSTLLAEMASCQLEYKYLAHLTGRKEYFEKVERVSDIMMMEQPDEGLWSTIWSADSGKQSGTQHSIGALADSAYEYLLKQYLLSSRSEPKFIGMYLKATKGILTNLLYVSPTRHLLYVTDLSSPSQPSHKLEHLSCFLPGLFALGAHLLDLPPRVKEQHQWVAEGLATTCYFQYADQASGLGPDESTFVSEGSRKWIELLAEWERDGKKGGVPPGMGRETKVVTKAGEKDYSLRNSGYFLRPETLESIFIMWRTTKNVEWRDRAWNIYESLEKNTRTEYGYSSIQNVGSSSPVKTNSMPSYFTAETLKYLYLTFSEDTLIPLDKFVFNTEAHPFPVFEWSEWEKEVYGIPMSSTT